MKELATRSEISATVTLPGSKSVTHRALVAASLGRGESILRNALICEDTLLTVEGLRKLGVDVRHQEGSFFVPGTGGQWTSGTEGLDIDLGNSGTSYRVFLLLSALGQGEYRLFGTPRMHQRPIGPLLKALRRLGVRVTCLEQEGFPPVKIEAHGLPGGRIHLEGGVSSQFVSSILLSGPCAGEDLELEVSGDPVSGSYVDMTLEVMKRFGVRVERDGYRYFRIRGGAAYQPRDFRVEGDLSSASYFWAAAAVTGGIVVTENLAPLETLQGDISFLDIIEEMGCHVLKEPSRVTVRGDELTGVDVDMNSMPDMVPTLSAMALFARGKTTIRNVAHLRHKESDRLGAIARTWRKLGGKVRELPDGLIIDGRSSLSGTLLNPQNDHRMAMSIAVLGLKVHGVLLENEACVAKSFPSFWELWDRLY